MFGAGKKKGTVRFSIKPQKGVKSVKLAGSFNDWQPVAMRKQAGGQYVSNIEVETGVYEYKFIIDNEWQQDPDNPQCVWNRHGTLNSVAIIQ